MLTVVKHLLSEMTRFFLSNGFLFSIVIIFRLFNVNRKFVRKETRVEKGLWHLFLDYLCLTAMKTSKLSSIHWKMDGRSKEAMWRYKWKILTKLFLKKKLIIDNVAHHEWNKWLWVFFLPFGRLLEAFQFLLQSLVEIRSTPLKAPTFTSSNSSLALHL